MFSAQLPPLTCKVTSYSREPTMIERIFYARIIRRFAERRRELEMTQEELDQELGVSEGQVAKWESFARLPGAFMFVCWSNRLGLTIDVELEALASQPEEDPRPCHHERQAQPLPRRRPLQRMEAPLLPLWQDVAVA